MHDMGDGEQHGRDRMHIGWYEPGRSICIGAGPMRMRMSMHEAEELQATLGALLDMHTSADRRHLCGCEHGESDSHVDELVRAAGNAFRGDFAPEYDAERCPAHGESTADGRQCRACMIRSWERGTSGRRHREPR